jgi:N-acetylglucosaminyl-diphospho-decaprenol L-rhamnosyltransferase
VRFSIVIVRYGDDLSALLAELARQRAPGDEVIVVDNQGSGELRGHPAVDRLLASPRNLGFAGGVNLAARHATGDALLLLNPDAVPEPACLERLRQPPDGWAAWMAVVTLPGGERINTAGNVAHFMGFGWVGRLHEPVAGLPSAPYATGFLSGAALAIRRDAWERVGGFPEDFFMYVEDVDLSHRLRLAGLPFGVLPQARVTHDYRFAKGAHKWRGMERNRWATVLRTYPPRVLAAALPAMAAAELPLLAFAAAGGWAGAKVGAWLDLVRWLPRAPAERRAVQRLRARPQREFADALASGLETPLLGRVGRSRLANRLLRAYWRLARRAVGLSG